MIERLKPGLRLIFTVWLLLPTLARGSDRALGAPSFEHATVTTYRAVTWDDFKGKGARPPGWNRWQDSSFAHIATALRAGKYRMADQQQGDEWLASAVGIRPYAIMNKDFSAVKHGSRNAYVLSHEQLHFDLAEAFARRLAVELAGLAGRGSSREEAREDLAGRIQERLDAGMQELGELQNRYDGETANGSRKKQQKKWAAAVPEMFREATEALEALIEERAATEPPAPAGAG